MDFLAYLLPGATALVALVAMLGSLADWGPNALSVLQDLSAATAVAIVAPLATAFSYVLGVLSSTLYPESLEKRFKERDPLASIHPPEAEPYVRRAFEEVFGQGGTWTWSATHFYLARAAVSEFLPATAARAYRQGSLRQFRRNLLIPILLWWLASNVWLFAGQASWGWKAVGAIALTFVAAGTYYRLFATGVIENRKREVREILCGLPLVMRRLHEA